MSDESPGRSGIEQERIFAVTGGFSSSIHAAASARPGSNFAFQSVGTPARGPALRLVAANFGARDADAEHRRGCGQRHPGAIGELFRLLGGGMLPY
jgi:hypothetical protein